MNIFKTIIISFLVLILVNSVQAAVVYGGKLYHSDSFNSSIGEKFTIIGVGQTIEFDNVTNADVLRYTRAIIRSTVDGSVEVLNGTCAYTVRYKYCYKEAVVDLNNEKAYEDDKYVQAAMSITVESLLSTIYTLIITRNQTINAYCNEHTVIPVIIRNGEVFPTNFTYYEELPSNTFIVSSNGGTVRGNVVMFSGRLQVNETRSYSYTVDVLDCKSKFWDVKYYFTTHNDTIYKSISNVSIFMLNSYVLNQSISTNKTNSDDDIITYTMNINNTHELSDLYVDLIITARDMVLVTPGLTTSAGSYRYTGVVSTASQTTLTLQYKTPKLGNYKLVTSGTISVGSHDSIINSTYDIVSVPPAVITYINIDNITSNAITISVISRNDDIHEKYYYIYGFLRGITSEESLYANGIDPKSEIILAKRTYDISGIRKNITLTFDGLYRDKNTKEYMLSDKKIVTISNTGQITIVDTVANTTKEVLNVTVSEPQPLPPTVTNTPAAPVVPPVEEKKDTRDVLTRIIDGFSKFLNSIFG